MGCQREYSGDNRDTTDVWGRGMRRDGIMGKGDLRREAGIHMKYDSVEVSERRITSIAGIVRCVREVLELDRTTASSHVRQSGR